LLLQTVTEHFFKSKNSKLAKIEFSRQNNYFSSLGAKIKVFSKVICILGPKIEF